MVSDTVWEEGRGLTLGLRGLHPVRIDKLVRALAVSLCGNVHNPLRKILIVSFAAYLHTNAFRPSLLTHDALNFTVKSAQSFQCSLNDIEAI